MKKTNILMSLTILVAVGITSCAESPKSTPIITSTISPSSTPSAPSFLTDSTLGPVQPSALPTVSATPESTAPTTPSKAQQATAKAESDKTRVEKLETSAKVADERLAKAPAGTQEAAQAAEEAQSLHDTLVKAKISAAKSATEVSNTR